MTQQELQFGAPMDPVAHCEWCGGTYKPYRRALSTQRFCGPSCSDSWHNTKRTKPDVLALRQSKRRTSKCERMLLRLREGPATTWELMGLGGAGFSSRLAELRRGKHDGVRYRISCEEREDHGVYTLENSDD